MTNEHAHEDEQTDKMIDAWRERLSGMTQAEVMDTIRRVSMDVEAIDDEQPTTD